MVAVPGIGSPAGRLPTRDLSRRVGRANQVTFAVAVLRPDVALVAADGLGVQRDDTGRVASTVPVTKTVRGARRIAVVAGDITVGSAALLPAAQALVRADGALDADARIAAETVKAAFDPWAARYLNVNHRGDVLLSLVVMERSSPGLRHGFRLEVVVDDGRLTLSAHRLKTGPDHALVLNIGNGHPGLDVLDSEYADLYDDLVFTATLNRQLPPAPPVHLPDDAAMLSEIVRKRLEHAVATEHLAPRPRTWPVGTPVAGLPISVLTI